MKRVLLLLALILVGAAGASAQQDQDKIEHKGFFGRSLNHVPGLKGPNQPSTENKRKTTLDHFVSGDEGEEARRRGPNGIWEGWMAFYEDEGQEGENPEDGEKPGTPDEKGYEEAGERVFHFNTAPPLQGHLMGMAGKSWAKSVEVGMKGPLTKKMIALMQTEPGVGAGVIAAEQIGMGRLSAVYQADQMMRDNLPDSEFARQVVLTTYNSCVAKEQEQGGWLNAAYKCTGDSEEEPDQHKVDEVSAEDKIKPDVHPDQDTEYAKDIVKSGVSKGSKEKAISVADALFNQNMHDSKAKNAEKKLEDLVKDWAMWFGDYELIFDDQTKEIGNVYSKRIFKEKRIAPEKTIGWLSYHIAMDRFKNFQNLMYEYCKHRQERADKSGGQVQKINDETKDSFVMNEKATKFYDYDQRMSAPEKPIQISVLSAILDAFVEQYANGKVGKNSGGGGGGGASVKSLECQDFKKPPEQVAEKDAIFQPLVAMYDYCSFLAVSQILRTFHEALIFVDRRSAGPGGVSSQVADYARHMVYEVARVEDIQDALQVNFIEWTKFVEERIFAKRRKNVGSFGGGVTDTAASGMTERTGASDGIR